MRCAATGHFPFAWEVSQVACKRSLAFPLHHLLLTLYDYRVCAAAVVPQRPPHCFASFALPQLFKTAAVELTAVALKVCDVGYQRSINQLCQPMEHVCKAPPPWTPPPRTGDPAAAPTEGPPALEPLASTPPPGGEYAVPPPGGESSMPPPGEWTTYYKTVAFGDSPCERNGEPVTCGGGIQQAIVTCYNSDGQRVGARRSHHRPAVSV